MTILETIGRKLTAYKPMIQGLIIGLVLGPFLTNYLGWQTTSGRAVNDRQAAVVEALSSICSARARADNREAAKLDWSARNDLARKWAVMPGATAADPAVTSACVDKLAG